MSTERQIPGGPFVNQTATAQRQIPGAQFLNDTIFINTAVRARRRPTQWAEQPQDPTGIDPSNKWTAGLVAWMPGNVPGWEAVSESMMSSSGPGIPVMSVYDVPNAGGPTIAPFWPGSRIQSTLNAGVTYYTNNTAPGLSSFTLAAWVYVDYTGFTGSNYAALICKGGVFMADSKFDFGIRFSSSYAYPYCYAHTSTNVVGFEGVSNLSVGWHRIVATWATGGICTIYVDGVFYDTYTSSDGTDAGQVITFGGPTTETVTDREFCQPAFDLRVYSRVWTLAEIQADMVEPHWQLFAPRTQYLPFGTASSGIPTLSAAMLMNLGSTYATPRVTFTF